LRKKNYIFDSVLLFIVLKTKLEENLNSLDVCS